MGFVHRKMDMLNGDLQLKNDATAKKQRPVTAASELDESEAGFHFIAFVPVGGRVWKLDGLQRQPQSLGKLALFFGGLDVEPCRDLSRPGLGGSCNTAT